MLLLCSDEKKIGLEQTEQKHLKKQKRVASRDRRDPSHETTNKTKLDEKSDENAADPTIQKRKKEKQLVCGRRSYLLLIRAQIFLSKSARAPKVVKVCFWSLESIIFGISLLLALSWS